MAFKPFKIQVQVLTFSNNFHFECSFSHNQKKSNFRNNISNSKLSSFFTEIIDFSNITLF